MTRTQHVPHARFSFVLRGVVLLVALALAPMTATAAQAGPKDRESEVRTAAAVLAEVMHHEASGKEFPKKLTRKKLRTKYGYDLAETFTIRKYQRLKHGTAFRVCLRHRGGGWATWHSAKGKLRASGKGKACRF